VTAYFHGGIPGLAAGDRVLPPSMTGTPTTADYGGAGVCRRDRVYATTELRFARVYAALAPFGGRGDVYEVELDDPIEPDGEGDSAAGDSVCAPSATVVQVIECYVHLGVAREEMAAQLALAAATAASSAAVAPLRPRRPSRVRVRPTGRAAHLSGRERATTALASLRAWLPSVPRRFGAA